MIISLVSSSIPLIQHFSHFTKRLDFASDFYLRVAFINARDIFALRSCLSPRRTTTFDRGILYFDIISILSYQLQISLTRFRFEGISVDAFSTVKRSVSLASTEAVKYNDCKIDKIYITKAPRSLKLTLAMIDA